MTAPGVRIVHRIAGRARLRARGKRGDKNYFAELEKALSGMNGVRSVRVNPVTESILIEHDGQLEPVLAEAEQRGYLWLDTEPPEPYLTQINRALAESDGKLKELSAGRMNLETLTFVGFVAGGIYQVTAGHALPAGVTLLRYAVELVTSKAVTSMSQARR